VAGARAERPRRRARGRARPGAGRLRPGVARAEARGAGETRGETRKQAPKKAKRARRGLSKAAEERATLELKAADPKLRAVIESVGELRDWRERRPDPDDHYGALVRT